jgi:hypothetical protein
MIKNKKKVQEVSVKSGYVNCYGYCDTYLMFNCISNCDRMMMTIFLFVEET